MSLDPDLADYLGIPDLQGNLRRKLDEIQQGLEGVVEERQLLADRAKRLLAGYMIKKEFPADEVKELLRDLIGGLNP